MVGMVDVRVQAERIAQRILEIQGGLGAPVQRVCVSCREAFGDPVNQAMLEVDEAIGFVPLCPRCMRVMAWIAGEEDTEGVADAGSVSAVRCGG